MNCFLKIFLFISPLLLIDGCSSVTKQSRKTTVLDASKEDSLGGTGTESGDLRSMTEEMALDIANLQLEAGVSRARIAITTVDNQTRFPINPTLIQDRLLTDLVQFNKNPKVQFTETPTGADYFLSVRLTALSKGSSEGVSDYILYSFKMTNKENTVVWMKAYETKKQGNVGVMYR